MDKAWFKCQSCGEEHHLGELYRCPTCGGELAIEYDLDHIKNGTDFLTHWREQRPFWERFEHVLPQEDLGCTVTLGEGNTPLVRSQRFAEKYELNNLYFKLESTNPTGSFKDRQMTVAISKANEWGRKRFGTASSGNVGVALSAYAARAGCKSYVWVSEGTAESKIQQIQVYGAQVFLLPNPDKGGLKEYFATYLGMQEYCVKRGMVPMISARPVNPYMIEGSKTISYETTSQLGRSPDIFFGPIGGGGMLGGAWKGFKELNALGLIDSTPNMWGAQREGYFAPVDKLGDPAYDWSDYYRPLDGVWAWNSIKESSGSLQHISQEDILRAQADLASLEGIFTEPQGAYATAGLVNATKAGLLPSDATIVSVITGMGLKDMSAAATISSTFPDRKPLVKVSSLDNTDLEG